MKLREILRFELAYQVRRFSTWLFFGVLVLFTLGPAMENFLQGAGNGDYFLNAPFVIAAVTALGSMAAWVLAASLAGNAAARDVQTRMHPLAYTTPVRKAEYLGGRFLAAFVLNALVLLGVPAGTLLAVLSSGLDADLVGPFRPATSPPTPSLRSQTPSSPRRSSFRSRRSAVARLRATWEVCSSSWSPGSVLR